MEAEAAVSAGRGRGGEAEPGHLQLGRGVPEAGGGRAEAGGGAARVSPHRGRGAARVLRRRAADGLVRRGRQVSRLLCNKFTNPIPIFRLKVWEVITDDSGQKHTGLLFEKDLHK